MGNVRLRGLKLIAVGLILAAAWIPLVHLLPEELVSLLGPAMGVPLVPLLIGLTEFASGRSFVSLAKSWDALTGWQRGLLGLVIVTVSGSVIVLGIGVALSMLTADP